MPFGPQGCILDAVNSIPFLPLCFSFSLSLFRARSSAYAANRGQRVWPFQNVNECCKQLRDSRRGGGYAPLSTRAQLPRGAKLRLR